MAAVWPISPNVMPSGTSWSPVDRRVTFAPDRGPSIDRLATTARMETWDMALVPMSLADFTTFEAWFDGDLAAGVNAFAFPHPITDSIGFWKFAAGDPPYKVTPIGYQMISITFRLMLLPSTPWWLAYVTVEADGTLLLPAWVYDDDAGVYGIP